jgi:CelD/BcsL family acetyltransferase involved in cellulose biosynthesis
VIAEGEKQAIILDWRKVATVSATTLLNPTVEVIADEGALAEVIDPWRRLAELRGNAFVTPDWYLIARRCLDPTAAPVVTVVRSGGGEVRGVLPLLRARAGRGPGLRFAGARYADLVHPAAAEEDEAMVASLAAPRLAEHVGSRCRLDLGRVDADSTWWRELGSGWSPALSAVVGPHEPLPYAGIAGSTWEEYLGTRSGQFRNQVRRKARSLERDHEVILRQPSSTKEVPGHVETLFRLHDARWRDRRDETALAESTAREFLAEFAAAAHDRGWLRLYSLEVDGEAVAAWYGWRLGGRFSYYQAGFDPDWSKYSVGFLMLARTVEAAIAEGAAEYDLLLGDEAFKARFATGERQGHSVLLTPSLSAARLVAVGKARGRSLVRALPAPLRDRVRALRQRIAGGG